MTVTPPTRRKAIPTKNKKSYHVFFDGCCDAGGFYTETSNKKLKRAVCPDCGETVTRVVAVLELS